MICSQETLSSVWILHPNYVGPEKFFQDEDSPFIRNIAEVNSGRALYKNNSPIETLPDGLEEAVCTFILATAIKKLRNNSNPHNTMLVNASQFRSIHGQLRSLIHARLSEIQRTVRVYGHLHSAAAQKYDEISQLHEVWQSEYFDLGFTWDQVFVAVREIVSSISVVEVNSGSAGRLNYRDFEDVGLNIIAVGGNALSRGLTLEGLTVSYFHRNSRMYDTLMQMGRWFGYRPGYEDKCRVWVTETAQGWYTHVAESIEILRADLREMEIQGRTPRDFGLRVRSHPDALEITARNKSKTGKEITVELGLSRELVETTLLNNDGFTLDANRRTAVEMVSRIAEVHPRLLENGSSHLFKNIEFDAIRTFLLKFLNHQDCWRTDKELLMGYINQRPSEMKKWDVLIPSLKAVDEPARVSDLLGFPVNCQRRSGDENRGPNSLLVTQKQRVASRGIERSGLPKSKADELADEFLRKHPGNNNPPDRIYRVKGRNPLFMLHLLMFKNEGEDIRYGGKPVIAWGISFPETTTPNVTVQYMVNTTYFQQHLIEPEEVSDDEDME